MSIINDSISARNHRLNTSHLKPPPLISNKRKRATKIDHDGEEEEESEDEYDEITGQVKTTEKVPAWDHLIFDDQEKLLSVMERVEREEERKTRRERMIRDTKETEARELAEAVAASEAAQRELGNMSLPNSLGSSLLTTFPGSSSLSTPATARIKKDGTPALTASGKPKKEPKPKKKKDGPSVTARTMSEDVRKRMSDATALRSVGGRTFGWMNASGGATPGFGSPGTPGGMTKFAPASSLPPPNFATPTRLSNSSILPNPFGQNSTKPLPFSSLSKSNVPLLHDANRNEESLQSWQNDQKSVDLIDIMWALERERGMGTGRGSGSRSLTKAWSTKGRN